MPTMLFVTGTCSFDRYEMKALGGRWNPKLQAWLLPVSRRPQVEKVARERNLCVDLYDTATGEITFVPVTHTFGDCTFTFIPHHENALLQSHLRRNGAPRADHPG